MLCQLLHQSHFVTHANTTSRLINLVPLIKIKLLSAIQPYVSLTYLGGSKVMITLEQAISKIDLLEHKIEEMKSLIDGAYEVVELYGINEELSPSQKLWKENWLKEALRFGAQPM